MQQYRQLTGDRHHGPFLGVLTTTSGYLLAVAPQVGVGGKWSQDIVGATYQKPPEHLIALPGDPFAGVTLAGLVLGRDKPQIRSYSPALFEPLRVLQGQHKAQGGQCPYSWDLPEQLALLWVIFLGNSLYAPLVVPDLLGEGRDGRHYIFKSLGKLGGQLIGDLFVEALCRALGQPGSERLDCTPSMVDQLRAAADQGIAGVDQSQVSLGLFAPVLDGVQKLGVDPGQAG